MRLREGTLLVQTESSRRRKKNPIPKPSPSPWRPLSCCIQFPSGSHGQGIELIHQMLFVTSSGQRGWQDGDGRYRCRAGWGIVSLFARPPPPRTKPRFPRIQFERMKKDQPDRDPVAATEGLPCGVQTSRQWFPWPSEKEARTTCLSLPRNSQPTGRSMASTAVRTWRVRESCTPPRVTSEGQRNGEPWSCPASLFDLLRHQRCEGSFPGVRWINYI